MIAPVQQRQHRSRKARSWLAAGLLVAGVSWGFQAGTPAAPRRHVVAIRGMTFQPPVLSVAPGDTVVWINRDLVPHTATGRGTGAWDTGILASGDSARYVPLGPGDWAYGCRLHPTMAAHLLVARGRGRAPGPPAPAAAERVR
jgi:plastocyanin